MEYDIVVGVSAKNCESSIEHVLKTIDFALTKYFPKKSATILIIDGYSKDKTKDLCNKLETKTEKRLLTEKGKKGKGSAVKLLLQKGRFCEHTLHIDGDFSNITPEVIKKLLTPLSKDVDVVIPRYQFDKNDYLIGNHLLYPLTKALFANVRQPIAGEFALSNKAVTKLLASTFFPADHSIGLFVTLTGICENLVVAEVKLDTKEHTSSQTNNRPEEHLMPAFNHIMREYIQLIRYYKNTAKKDADLEVKKLGSASKKRPKRIDIDPKVYEDLSRGIIKTPDEYMHEVYTQLNKQSLMGLKVAWLNWVAVYLDLTKNMSTEKAEKEIEKLVVAAKKHKDMLKL